MVAGADSLSKRRATGGSKPTARTSQIVIVARALFCRAGRIRPPRGAGACHQAKYQSSKQGKAQADNRRSHAIQGNRAAKVSETVRAFAFASRGHRREAGTAME